MSRNHSTAIAGGALVSSIPYSQPPSGSAAALKPNSFAAVNWECYGLLAPLLASRISGAAMYLATIVAIYEDAPTWAMPFFTKAMLAGSILIALVPPVFFLYRTSIQLAAMSSGAAFLAVAMFLPMTTGLKLLFGVGVVLSLVASVWANEFGEQP